MAVQKIGQGLLAGELNSAELRPGLVELGLAMAGSGTSLV